MANKAISELPQAQNVNNQDLFVLEQSGIAKKLTAETFITEQGIIDALAEALDGHGGIQSVTLSSVSGRIRTYLITFTDQSATTFQVLDGTSIDRIVKTSTAGLTDTYTVFMNDGTTTFFTVTNGADGTVSEAMLNDALKDKAPAVTETTESSAIANFADGADDMVMHNVVAEIDPVQDLTYGDPYPAGGGKNKFYSSISNSATLNGVTCSFDANTQTFTINGANESSSAYILLSVTPTEDIVRNVALSRAFIGAPTGVYINLVYNDGSWHGLNNGGTLPDSVSIENVRIQVGILGTAGSFTPTTFKCQLQEGSSAPASWTPYENICPISGWTGCNVTRAGKNIADKNIFDINKPSWSTAQYWLGLSENADGTYTLTRPIGWGGHGYVYIGTYPAGTYTVSFDLKSTASVTCGAIIRAYNTKTWVTNAQKDKSGMTTTGRQSMPTITTTAVCDFWLAVGPYTNNGAQVISGDYQVEVGKTATAYEPYQDSSVTVDWTTEAGTVYGGTIDVATGLLTVDRACVTLEGKTSISMFNVTTDGIVPCYLNPTNFTGSGSADYGFPSPKLNQRVVLCNWLKYGTDIKTALASNMTTWSNTFYRYEFAVPISDAVAGDAGSTHKTAVIDYLNHNPLQLCYELATSQTYQLSGQQLKTLLGTNNVQASTGNTSVTYPADTKMFIEKLTMPTEDDLIANQAITSGKYFMIGNSLYLALANIASGAQITIGTNAQRVSLADALNTINS